MIKILVLHGWGQNKESWQEIVSKFEDDTVIAIDLPGFGGEPLSNREWGIPEYAEWVEKYITTHELGNVILLGHSFGGRIASYLASKNPSWLRTLVLYGAPSIYRPSINIKVKISIYKLLKSLGFRRKNTNQELNDADNKGLGKIFRNVVTFDQTEYLPLIRAKTLLIWGEKDTEVPLRIATEMNALISESKLVLLEGLGHNAHLENPTLFYGKIKQFCETL